MSLTIRRSRKSDLFGISYLISRCFGNRDDYWSLDGAEDKYWLCIDEETHIVVGMSGLKTSNDFDNTGRYGDTDIQTFNGAEVAWSCVLPEYRRQGIMTQLLVRVIWDAKERGYQRLYCSALRVHNKNKANMHGVLLSHGFELVIKPVVSFAVGHNCSWGKTVCRNCIGTNCTCHEDLYVKYLDK